LQKIKGNTVVDKWVLVNKSTFSKSRIYFPRNSK